MGLALIVNPIPILDSLRLPKPELSALAKRLRANPGLLPEVLSGLRAREAGTRYGSLKFLRYVSETEPELLYSQFEFFANLLASDNNIIRWGAIRIVGNLAAVDMNGKIPPLLERYLQPLSGPVMITAANTIAGAVQIAIARPALAETIVSRLLEVEHADYQTPECRNVALGHVFRALETLAPRVRNLQPLLDLARRHFRNPRNAVSKAANRLVKKFGRTAGTSWQAQSSGAGNKKPRLGSRGLRKAVKTGRS